MTRPAMRYEFPYSSITLCLAMRLCSPPSNRALFCASSANTKRKNSLLGPPSSTAASEMNVTRIPPEYTLFLRDNTSFVSLQTCRLLTAIHRDGSSCASISSFWCCCNIDWASPLCGWMLYKMTKVFGIPSTLEHSNHNKFSSNWVLSCSWITITQFIVWCL